MRLALRIIISILKNAENQLDQIEHEIRSDAKSAAFHDEFKTKHRALRLAISGLAELNDKMGDAGL
jgi:hypothetical protein